jgi:hypothetical protein
MNRRKNPASFANPFEHGNGSSKMITSSTKKFIDPNKIVDKSVTLIIKLRE